MSLILVVEPDSRHAAQLASIARNHLHAELVMADSGDRAVAALADRVPDIVLTAPLLPHRDEERLSDYLRALGDAGAHVQTLTIPILSTPAAAHRGVRGVFRKERAASVLPDGCDPALFAEQVGQYLHRARQRRVAIAPPPRATIAFQDAAPVDEVVGQLLAVPEAEDVDVDLTPFLTDIAEPVEPEEPADRYTLSEPYGRCAGSEPSERFDASGRLDAIEPVATFELVEPIEDHVPGEPAEPYEHVEPVEPIRPRVFAEPLQTVAPVTPVAPVELVQPAAPIAAAAPVEPAARFAPAEPIEAVEPIAFTELVAPRESIKPVAPLAKAAPAAPVAPPVRPVAAAVEPLTSYAQAPSRADLLPAVISPRRERRRPDPVQEPAQQAALVPQVMPQVVPQVINVPTGGGGSTQASVNVAVAVSVQVATQTTVTSTPPARTPKGGPKPIQDEWGFFDPDQCGFRALLARLDAIAAKEDEE